MIKAVSNVPLDVTILNEDSFIFTTINNSVNNSNP